MSTSASISSKTTDGLDLDLRFRGKCEGGTGPNLSRYPSLTYAPQQWGDGVRTHVKGKHVADVVAAAAKSGFLAALDTEAGDQGLEVGELLNAIEFARATKAV